MILLVIPVPWLSWLYLSLLEWAFGIRSYTGIVSSQLFGKTLHFKSSGSLKKWVIFGTISSSGEFGRREREREREIGRERLGGRGLR
jgi:hypothetical protein